jgi:hypothetical protein
VSLTAAVAQRLPDLTRKSNTMKRSTAFGVAAGLAGLGIAYKFFQKRPSSRDRLAALQTEPEPARDVFDNRGEENIVQPMTVEETQRYGKDSLNPLKTGF